MEFSLFGPRCFNFVVLGDVGKSHFRNLFCEGHRNMPSDLKFGTQLGCRREVIQGEPIQINICEVASLPSFRSLMKAYYQGATGAFLIFDVTNRPTFDSLEAWIEASRWAFQPDMHFYLVATTTDPWKERHVSPEEAQKFAKENNLQYVDINTAEKSEVEKLVISTANEVWSDIKSGKLDENDWMNGVIPLQEQTKGLARCF